MKKMKVCLSIIISLFLLSCENDMLESVQQVEVENQKTKSVVDVFIFTYEDITYSSAFSLNPEGKMILEDTSAAKIFEKLEKFPNLAGWVKPNGVVEYFENAEKLQESFANLKEMSPMSFESRVTTSGILRVYKDSKLKGEMREHIIDDSCVEIAIPSLGSLDNELSSAYLECKFRTVTSDYPVISKHGNRCVATFFRFGDYQGPSMWFAVDPLYPVSPYHYFKSTPMVGTSHSWNDQASSIIFRFAN